MYKPTVYSIHFKDKPGRATTIVMSSLRKRDETKEEFSVLWK